MLHCPFPVNPRRLLVGVSFSLCALVSVPGSSAAPRTTWLDEAAPEHEAAVKTGEAAAAAVFSRLQTALLAEIARAGPVGAIALCREQALRLTAEAAAGAGQAAVEVKRTSLRVRNPRNRPDPAERIALEAVAARVGEGKPAPVHLLQRVEHDGGKVELRYYRSVGVAPLCVTCHGPREALAGDLARALTEAYPTDEAVGYRAGDWRGLLRVSLPGPADGVATTGSAARSR